MENYLNWLITKKELEIVIYIVEESFKDFAVSEPQPASVGPCAGRSVSTTGHQVWVKNWPT